MVARLFASSLAAVVVGCTAGRAPIHRPADTPDTRWLHDGEHLRWTFDDVVTPGTEPMPRVGPEMFVVLGNWRPERDDEAPSAPNVFRQSRAYGADDAPRVLVTKVTFARMTATVKCRPEGGANAGCGLVFHALSADDYLLAYFDARGAIALSEIQGGVAHEVARAPAPGGGWRTLGVAVEREAYGVIEVALDGRTLLTVGPGAAWQSDLPTRDGAVGLLTKGDAITAFDDLDVIAGVGALRPLEVD